MTSPYSASLRDKSSSGASFGRPPMAIGSTTLSGNFSPKCRRSDLRRRTITASSSPGRTGTARVKRIKDFKQTEEGIRVAMVRGRRQEEPVFEALSEPTHCARELAVDCVARPAGRCGMMRLVEDKESSRTEIAQHVPQTTDVSLVGHERMRDDKARTGRPRIGCIAAVTSQGGEVFAIHQSEGEAKLCLKFILPLPNHSSGSCHEHEINATSQQHLAENQTCFHRLIRSSPAMAACVPFVSRSGNPVDTAIF